MQGVQLVMNWKKMFNNLNKMDQSTARHILQVSIIIRGKTIKFVTSNWTQNVTSCSCHVMTNYTK